MTSTSFVRRAAWLAALSIASAAQAAPVTVNTGKVAIDYDTDGFSFTRDTTAFGGVGTEDVSPSLFNIQGVGNGIEIDFNGQMSVQASSYTNNAAQTLSGNFNAFFNFKPIAGYVITGYTLSFSGDYHIETPGYVYLLDATGAGVSETTGSGGFNVSSTVAGGSAPAIQGGFTAMGDVNTIQVFDGYDNVIDHYEDVLDHCEDNDPSVCYYRQEAVYITQPIYHDETDLGEASFNLRKVTLTANVAAVPEPSGHWLLLAGLPLAAWRLARRQARTPA